MAFSTIFSSLISRHANALRVRKRSSQPFKLLEPLAIAS